MILMHAFYIHPDHVAYFLGFSGFIVTAGAISTSLRLIFRDAPYSILMLTVWAALLSLAFEADYYDLSPRSFFALCISIVSLIGVYGYSLSRREGASSFGHAYWGANSFRDLCITFLTWLAGLFLLLVPLGFGFPRDTLIPNHFICNDSVVHSIMCEGLAFMKARGLDEFYYSSAPRGLHSFNYYFKSLLGDTPVSHFILPIAIAAYSLVILWAEGLLAILKVPRFSKFILALLPVSPFLDISAVYAMFLGQVSGMAPTFSALTVLFFLSKVDSKLERSVSLFLVLTVGALSGYGLFSGSIIAFGIALATLATFIRNPSVRFWMQTTIELLRRALSIPGIIFILSLLLLINPIVQFAIYMAATQGSGKVASDLSSAVGNLPDGYLSPMHLTGIWPPGVGYREALVKQWSAWGDALLFLLLAQAFFAFRAMRMLELLLLFLCFAVPTFATTVMLKSPYVHFKYFTYVTPVFLQLAGIGVFQTVDKGRALWKPVPAAFFSLLSSLIIGAFIFAAVFIPLPTATIIPALGDQAIKSLEVVSQRIQDKRALVLSREDWVQYYIQSDDIAPLTLYIPQLYSNSDIDIIVFDRGYVPDIQEYLKSFPDVQKMLENKRCMDLIDGRYEIFSFPCP